MTEKIRNLLENVQTVYEGKRIVVHPNSFDRLRKEVFKLDNINIQQSEQLTKAKKLLKWFVWYFREGSSNLVPYKHKVAETEQFLKEVENEV